MIRVQRKRPDNPEIEGKKRKRKQQQHPINKILSG